MSEAVLVRVVARLPALHDMPSCGDFCYIDESRRSMRASVPEQGAEFQEIDS